MRITVINIIVHSISNTYSISDGKYTRDYWFVYLILKMVTITNGRVHLFANRRQSYTYIIFG